MFVNSAKEYHKYCLATALGLSESSPGYLPVRFLPWFFTDSGNRCAERLRAQTGFEGRACILGLPDLRIVGCDFDFDRCEWISPAGFQVALASHYCSVWRRPVPAGLRFIEFPLGLAIEAYIDTE